MMDFWLPLFLWFVLPIILLAVFILRTVDNPKYDKSKIVQYDPPEDINPLETCLLFYGEIKTCAIYAEFLDLSRRGHIKLLYKVNKAGDRKYYVFQNTENYDSLLQPERNIVDFLIGTHGDHISDGLHWSSIETLGMALTSGIDDRLYQLIKTGLEERGITVRSKTDNQRIFIKLAAGLTFGLIGIVMIGSGLDAVNIGSDFLGAFAIPTFFAALIAAPLMFVRLARRDKQAVEVTQYLRGLDEYIDKTHYLESHFPKHLSELATEHASKDKLGVTTKTVVIRDKLLPWVLLLDAHERLIKNLAK